MLPKLLLIVLCAAFLFLNEVQCERKKVSRKCSMSREDVQVCASGVFMMGNRGVDWPSTLEEGRKFCSNIRKNVVCVGNYRHCVTGFKKSLIGAFGTYALKELDLYCNYDLLTLIIQNAKCLIGDSIRKEEFIKCADRHVVMSDFIVANVTSLEKVSAACCGFAYYRECYHNFAESFCTHIVGDESAKLVDEILLRLVNTFSVCSEKYASTKNCAKNLPGYDIVFKEIAAIYEVPQNKKAVLMDLFDIFSA